MFAIVSISVLILGMSGLSACTNDNDKPKKEQVSVAKEKSIKKESGDNLLVISKTSLGDGYSIEE